MIGSLFDGLGPEPNQPSGEWFTAHCDGGSRGNPGPAGYGAVIQDARGQTVARLSGYVGRQTNNYAEYRGLLAVLKWAAEHGAKRLRVISDSELMVKQIKGQYKVKNPGLFPLWEEARRLERSLDRFEITHTLRAGNAEADRLANEAMDRGMGRTSDQETRGPGHQENRQQGPPGPAASTGSPKTPRQVLEGYVKDGVVHLLEGELPDGIFVKVIRE
jgi:ribonuclease HI